MTELHHKSHEHPLVFNEDTASPSDTTYDCAGCDEEVFGSSYSCGECRFYLHKKCAEAPSEIRHPAHCDHPLLLLLRASEHQTRDVCCRLCGRCEVKGFIYHCSSSSSCEFYLDLKCALLPRDTAGNLIETLHVSHPHPLISFNPVRYFECAGCLDPLMDDASFACFDCRKFFHKICLVPPTSITHPCHRKHQLLPVFSASGEDFPECNLCLRSIQLGFYYHCVPCKFYLHFACAWPPPIIEDESNHDHPFTLLLKPHDSFDCNACGIRGNYISYICFTCNIQVHLNCISLPHHIKLTLHPHPISHRFFPYIDQHDSRAWDCKICYEKVNIDHGSYYCSQPGCDFVIHVKCSIEKKKLYSVVEVENPDEFEECGPLYEPLSCIIRIIKEIKVGGDVIAGEILHVRHQHNLIFSDEIKGNKYCNGCALPILSSFYYCSHCDFFLHKTCAELPRRIRPWFTQIRFGLHTSGVFRCVLCKDNYSGFSYIFLDSFQLCLRCASIPHSFTYHADEPHFLFFVEEYEGNCNACGKDLSCEKAYRCKDCMFALDWRCVALPRTAWHKCDHHSLALAYQDCDDDPLRHYCDICEEERDPEKWFYYCETCDNAMHIECVLGEYPFIKAGSKYSYKGHPHPLRFVKKTYYYPECVLCGEPCQDLALECEEHGCKYIVHWRCMKPDFPVFESKIGNAAWMQVFIGDA